LWIPPPSLAMVASRQQRRSSRPTAAPRTEQQRRRGWQRQWLAAVAKWQGLWWRPGVDQCQAGAQLWPAAAGAVTGGCCVLIRWSSARQQRSLGGWMQLLGNRFGC
jgi:hypothetical protein